jgi:glycosyltransferase involved in cell wall biosynthesis
MLNLTIVIPVLNEEKNLPGCLKAIGKDFAEQIIVLDSGSTDSTRQIAEQSGAEYLLFQWDGKFPKKRNWLLRNYPPTTKWVLFLDADEYLTEEFKKEVSSALQKDDCDGYWLNYTIYFMGRKLRGGYPLNKLALFRVGAGEYERIDENQWSKLDMEIHEHPVITGKVGKIKGKIDHQDFRGASHYVNKHTEYAAWEAARYMKAMGDTAVSSQWTWKQRLKYRLMRSVWIGPVFFCGSFFLLGGFRDGARGFAFAILKMSYFTLIYCKIRESMQEQ